MGKLVFKNNKKCTFGNNYTCKMHSDFFLVPLKISPESKFMEKSNYSPDCLFQGTAAVSDVAH